MMAMVTKLVRVVTYRKELSLINLYRTYMVCTSQWRGLVRSRDKLNIPYIQLERTHRNQTREYGDLP